ncbi:MAG: hypothetical protein QM535_02455 [Limnohabitans sp.]|nr:hypothetical protein [Limnohabitans sp.]
MNLKRFFLLVLVFAGMHTYSQKWNFLSEISKINSVNYHLWVSGVKGGGSGANFTITLKEPMVGLELEKMLYNSQLAEFRTNDGLVYTTSYYYPSDDEPVFEPKEDADRQRTNSCADDKKASRGTYIRLYFRLPNGFYLVKRFFAQELSTVFYP